MRFVTYLIYTLEITSEFFWKDKTGCCPVVVKVQFYWGEEVGQF
jgi:hypothetical protein